MLLAGHDQRIFGADGEDALRLPAVGRGSAPFLVAGAARRVIPVPFLAGAAPRVIPVPFLAGAAFLAGIDMPRARAAMSLALEVGIIRESNVLFVVTPGLVRRADVTPMSNMPARRCGVDMALYVAAPARRIFMPVSYALAPASDFLRPVLGPYGFPPAGIMTSIHRRG
jgi:hypothetical protein